MEDRPTAGRRQLLRLLGGAVGASLALPFLARCDRAEQAPSLSVPVAELPLGRRVRMQLGEVPIELRRTDEGVEVRSLHCTHMGCEVRWVAERSVYECACHKGRFDADGKVLGGPPPRPLDRLPARVEGRNVVVDG